MNERPLRVGARPQQQAFYQDLVARHGSPLLVLHTRVLEQQYLELQQYLPNVALYYAIKAFPHNDVLQTLYKLGAHFDVASAGETDLLQQLNISGRDTIHTHPVKKDADIRSALRGGSTTFVVDNIEELKKLQPYRSRVGVLLRVSFRSESAAVDLSRKFGCTPADVPGIASQARDLGIHIRGLSFHVGSQSLSPTSHVQAIKTCAELIREVHVCAENPMDILDIGGGFPVDYNWENPDMARWFEPVRQALQEHIPRDINIIAEPGRFLVAPAVTAIASVTGKARRGNHIWYYLDDGVYGSYSGQIFDHARYPLQILRDEGPRQPSVLAGPTCDSIDIIAEDIALPLLQEGDLLIGHMMGAYTHATATRFNSLAGATIVVI